MTGDRCRSCGAGIRWGAVAASGKNMPLDVEPHPDGNVRIARDGFLLEVLGGVALPAARARGDELYRSHFATCPDAGAHRRRTAAARGRP